MYTISKQLVEDSAIAASVEDGIDSNYVLDVVLFDKRKTKHADDHVYTAGQEVEGEVVLTLDFVLPYRGVTVRLCGVELAYGSTGDGRFSSQFQQKRVIVDESKILAGRGPADHKRIAREFLETVKDANSEKKLYAVMQPGTHRWPFRFELPADGLPGDYQSKFGSAIVYQVQARVDVPFATDMVAIKDLTIVEEGNGNSHAIAIDQEKKRSGGGGGGMGANGIVPQSELVDAASQRVVHATNNKEFLFDSGIVSAHVHIPNDTFHLGDLVQDITLSVKNKSGHHVRGARVALYQRETVWPEDQEFTHVTQLAKANAPATAVKAGADRMFTLSFRIPTDIYASITSAKLIRVTHFLRFTLDIAWALDLNVDVPIYLLESERASTRKSVVFRKYPRKIRSNL
eukprot:TRINITY_DN66083_c11_g1_i1.p1 TRINITY_DN66083_c11_g1~~TRINITY_DN66083_c11_g1_i1.p1  ORF type:complete len:422 (-),score=209.44 TRINITY_DN66083_c11_g1_i1:80-1282(-)